MTIRKVVLPVLTRVVVFTLGLFSGKTRFKAKRILFLGGLATALKNLNIIGDSELDRVGEYMLGIKNEEMLGIAHYFTKPIWDADVVSQDIRKLTTGKTTMLSYDELVTLSDRLITDTPQWLRYNPRTMQKDLVNLLTNNFNEQ